MRRDRSYWKIIGLLAFSATASTGLFAANPKEEQGTPGIPTGTATTQQQADLGQGRVGGTRQPSQVLEQTPRQKKDAQVQDVLRQALLAPAEAKETGDPILDGVLEVIQERGSIVAAWLPETPDFKNTDTQALPPPQLMQGQYPAPQPPQAQPFPGPQPQYPQAHVPRTQPFTAPQGQVPNYPSLAPDQLPHSFLPPNNPSRTGVNEAMLSPQQEQQFLLAEQLLMTARLLTNDLDQQRGYGFSNERSRDDGQRRQLIRMLREEAARCLNTQTRSNVQPPSPHANQVPIPRLPASSHQN